MFDPVLKVVAHEKAKGKRSCGLRTTFEESSKSSERGRISSENRQNIAICSFFCNKQNNTWLFLDMEFLVTRSRQSLEKYRAS